NQGATATEVEGAYPSPGLAVLPLALRQLDYPLKTRLPLHVGTDRRADGVHFEATEGQQAVDGIGALVADLLYLIVQGRLLVTTEVEQLLTALRQAPGSYVAGQRADRVQHE